MALDIRLDFVMKISPDYIDAMKLVRLKFVELDKDLQLFVDEASASENHAAARSAAIARTNIESALQSTIKTLCLLGEIK